MSIRRVASSSSYMSNINVHKINKGYSGGIQKGDRKDFAVEYVVAW
jgi:hypothetical protein